MTAWYNEIDPYCAEWLRNLIAAGEIPAGDVDERPIEEVTADDIRHYTQCHFFAGVGGWAYAARLAGWPDDRTLWTGSCPCQPFSVAGKRLAYGDPRNLWPDFARLIKDCRPPAVAGEQVASKAGRLWLAGVRADLEALGYGVGAADLCAAGVSAPHPRQRLWWVADLHGAGCDRQSAGDRKEESLEVEHGHDAERCGVVRVRVADSERGAAERHGHEMAGAPSSDQGREEERQWLRHNAWDGGATGIEWIECTDGRSRRIEPGIEPLVTRLPGHVEQVRAYGNSIVPQEAAEVLMAWREAA